MEKNIINNGKNVFYRVVGKGKTVVLIHGFGEDGTVWNNQIEFLKNKYRLIIPDIPGSGKSEIIDDMSMEGLAEFIMFILQSESPNQPTFGGGAILGHSMGGYIALAFAEKYAESVLSLGLLHSTAFADSEEKKITRRKGIDFIRQHGPMEFLKTAIPNLFSEQSKLKNPQVLEDFIRSLPNFTKDALVSYYEGMMNRPDRTSVLKSMDKPVLFLFGKHDTAIPLSDGLKQCHLPEISYIHILKNSGHMGMLEESSETNRIVDEFLQQTENIGTLTNQ